MEIELTESDIIGEYNLFRVPTFNLCGCLHEKKGWDLVRAAHRAILHKRLYGRLIRVTALSA